MNFLLRLYTAYAAFLFLFTFLIFFPFFYISAQKEKWHKLALRIDYIWARIYFPIIFLNVELDLRFKPQSNKQYILCANHFSYFDVPSMARIPIYSKFIGKNSIASVPLFGYMFRKIHITVERSSMKSRAGIIYRAREAVDAGYNLTFFPEGGVRTTSPPQMTSFSDGAFRLAIEKNLPIVPITFHNNYKILPDDERFVLHPGKMKIVVHEPVSPKINDEAEISALRKEVFEIIQAELNSAHEIT